MYHSLKFYYHNGQYQKRLRLACLCLVSLIIWILICNHFSWKTSPRGCVCFFFHPRSSWRFRWCMITCISVSASSSLLFLDLGRGLGHNHVLIAPLLDLCPVFQLRVAEDESFRRFWSLFSARIWGSALRLLWGFCSEQVPAVNIGSCPAGLDLRLLWASCLPSLSRCELRLDAGLFFHLLPNLSRHQYRTFHLM